MKKALSLVLACILVLALFAGCGNSSAPAPAAPAKPAEAEVKWPNGKITLYVPAEAGAPVDLGARVWADALAAATGETVEVVNDASGDGERLIQMLKNAAPDGKTLFYGGMGQVLMYYSGVHQDNLADTSKFTAVASAIGLGTSGSVLLTQPDAPYDTLDQLVEYVKANPGKVTCALSSGTGRYLYVTVLLKELGIYDDVRIVEATSTETTTGLLGGTINIASMNDSKTPQYVIDGSLKPLCLLRNDRNYDNYIKPEEMSYMDAIPTYVDLGLEHCYYTLPTAVFGPAGMSPELCNAIVDDLKILFEDEWVARTKEQAGRNNAYDGYTSAEVAEFIRIADDVCKKVLQ